MDSGDNIGGHPSIVPAEPFALYSFRPRAPKHLATQKRFQFFRPELPQQIRNQQSDKSMRQTYPRHVPVVTDVVIHRQWGRFGDRGMGSNINATQSCAKPTTSTLVHFNRSILARLVLIMAMNRLLGTALCISSFTLIVVEVWSTRITGAAVVNCSPGQPAFCSPIPGRVIFRRTDRRINTRGGES